MDRDRKSIGLTPEARGIIEEIELLKWFNLREDIARFCMAYAIRVGVQEGVTTGTDTAWAAGNFDSTGEIRVVLAALYPNCQSPVHLMEHLVNEGLRLVGEKIRVEGWEISDFME